MAWLDALSTPLSRCQKHDSFQPPHSLLMKESHIWSTSVQATDALYVRANEGLCTCVRIEGLCTCIQGLYTREIKCCLNNECFLWNDACLSKTQRRWKDLEYVSLRRLPTPCTYVRIKGSVYEIKCSSLVKSSAVWEGSLWLGGLEICFCFYGAHQWRPTSCTCIRIKGSSF